MPGFLASREGEKAARWALVLAIRRLDQRTMQELKTLLLRVDPQAGSFKQLSEAACHHPPSSGSRFRDLRGADSTGLLCRGDTRGLSLVVWRRLASGKGQWPMVARIFGTTKPPEKAVLRTLAERRYQPTRAPGRTLDFTAMSLAAGLFLAGSMGCYAKIVGLEGIAKAHGGMEYIPARSVVQVISSAVRLHGNSPTCGPQPAGAPARPS